MLPIGDNQISRHRPIITYTLIALNVLIYLWDRQFNPLANGFVFGDLAMRPVYVLQAVFGTGDRFALVTVFTSLFLHGNLIHLIGNMLFLLTFGEAVEDALGTWRFMLYYFFWGIVACATQILVDPTSATPTLGASGAIGGVLGCYFLLFPANKIEILLYFTTFTLEAWKLLGLWFLWQVLVPQEGVATWAHAGGFLAGMLTVLIMGGRARIVRGREHLLDMD
jgi:membrane associated rhomboid family serine protease